MTMDSYTIDRNNQTENSNRLLVHFDCYRVAYRYVHSQPIHAALSIPKTLPTGPRPLLVRFHGGGLTEGEAESFMRPFFLELALKHGAIIITPNYRLRPEHDMVDAIDDIRFFWKWTEHELQQVLLRSHSGPELDVDNLLVGGESGGGYLVVQTALLGLTSLKIKVLFLQYPALDLASFLRVPDVPTHPYSVIEEYLAAREPGKIRTRAPFGSRMDLMGAMISAGKFCDFEGENQWLDPMHSLEGSYKLPPILLYHSKEDEMLPWDQTQRWAEKLLRLQPEVFLKLVYSETGGHVFDVNYDMKSLFMREPLKFVECYWPAGEKGCDA